MAWRRVASARFFRIDCRARGLCFAFAAYLLSPAGGVLFDDRSQRPADLSAQRKRFVACDALFAESAFGHALVRSLGLACSVQSSLNAAFQILRHARGHNPRSRPAGDDAAGPTAGDFHAPAAVGTHAVVFDAGSISPSGWQEALASPRHRPGPGSCGGPRRTHFGRKTGPGLCQLHPPTNKPCIGNLLCGSSIFVRKRGPNAWRIWV